MKECTVVNQKDKSVVKALGKEYLKTCFVHEWNTTKGGFYFPRSWLVPIDKLEQEKIKYNYKDPRDVRLDAQAEQHLKDISREA